MNNLVIENAPHTFFKLTSTDYYSLQITLEKIEQLFGLRFQYMKDYDFYYTVTDYNKYNLYKLKKTK